ncbi:protein of unknown function [Azospirillum lipoferum 4B]|uniref:Uncharacterized protein n=1 Tax=Azospirillum lipoferum (strain 4B) TaxID=862719 RepID=G7Z222_AZOL4|nr:protein of unknown function [Azospirillum lipoferum 4B]
MAWPDYRMTRRRIGRGASEMSQRAIPAAPLQRNCYSACSTETRAADGRPQKFTGWGNA